MTDELAELADDAQAAHRLFDQSCGDRLVLPPQAPTTAVAMFLFYTCAGGRVDIAAPLRTNIDWAEHTRSVGDKIIAEHAPPEADVSVQRDDDPGKTRTASVPNQYNSPIYVAGFLAGARSTGTKLTEHDIRWCGSVVQFIMALVDTYGGYVPRLYETTDDGTAAQRHGPPAASAYLTFWCYAALDEWARFTSGRGAERAAATAVGASPTPEQPSAMPSAQSLDVAMMSMRQWAAHRVHELLAYTDAGLRVQFDVIEAVYAMMVALMATASARTAALSEPMTREVAVHVLSVVFRGHFNNGCFDPSAPVIADSKGMSVQISTAEALALVLSLQPRLLQLRVREVMEAHQWLRRHHVDGEGWYPESQVGRTNEFMTASALFFLDHFQRLVHERVSQLAKRELGASHVDQADVANVPYPGDLADVVEAYVHKPLVGGGDAALASYSMILYGPPGTAKTTIAKKIAADLGWPLVELGPGRFLRRGVEHMDAQADEVFSAAAYLRQAVLFFDELEELVTNRELASERESRLMTTSMLPRIQRLRDLEQVVFIFATNRLDRIDSAIARLGRFDIIRCVLPPDERQRVEVLRALLRKYQADGALQQAVLRDDVIRRTDRFVYGDLKDFVKQLVVETTVRRVGLSDQLIDDVLGSLHPIKQEQLDEFVRTREEADRPRHIDLAGGEDGSMRG